MTVRDFTPRSERWRELHTPDEMRQWRFFLEADLDDREKDSLEMRNAQRRITQLTGGAVVALCLNLVLLLVTLKVGSGR